MSNKIQSIYKEDSIIKLANLDEYNMYMNQNPPAKWLKTNKYANNSLYLPIDKVELMLRKIYKAYRVEVLREGAMFNSVYATVRLHYLHPVTGEWDWTDGGGANNSHNAVDKAYPIAIAEATKNAAKKLGRIFGGDLNRKDTIPFTEDEKLQDKKFNLEKERLLTAIENGYIPTENEKEKFDIQD